jgi:hypothetical protein
MKCLDIIRDILSILLSAATLIKLFINKKSVSKRRRKGKYA